MRRLLLFLYLIFLSTFSAFAEERGTLGFVAATTPFFAGPGDGAKPIGKLLSAAALRLIGAPEDRWQRVEVSGWTQAGAERALQAAPGLRVTRAGLSKAGLEALSFGEERTDPGTGLVWIRTTLTGSIPADSEIAPDIETLWARAEPLFATRCTACHERRVPSRYTANQWTSYLKVMGPRTGLPKDDQALIRVFLQYHSADAAALAQALAED